MKKEIEKLVQLRTKMILEGMDIYDISIKISELENQYKTLILEDTSATGGVAVGGSVGSTGVAMANASIGGMGGVVSSQPALTAGVTIDPGYTSNGGLVGSGDIGVPYNAGGKKAFQKLKVDNRRGTNRRRKNKMLAGLKSAFSKKQDYTAGQGKPRTKKIMSFSSFEKDELNKVTHVKDL